MSQKRESIRSRKQTLLESQQQGQAAAAASQSAASQPHSSIAASVPSFAATTVFSAAASTSTSAAHTYGNAASTQLATGQPVQPGYPYPGGNGNQAYPSMTPGYGSHMPFQPGAPYPPRMGHSGPAGQRFPNMPHDTPAHPAANSGPGGPRPGFPGARPPFGAAQTPAGENQTDFEQYGDGEDTAAGAQFVQGSRPPFEAAGGRPPFGQPFRGPRPGAPNEFGMQAPFRPNQPQVGLGQRGPRPGFGPGMHTEGGESSADMGGISESGDQFSPSFGRGMRPGMPMPGMGPRPGFPRGPRPMGMIPPHQQASGFMEGTDENSEEPDSWLGDGMQGTSGGDFGPRGMRPEGPRFSTPTSGFPGRGDIRGPGPRFGDPRMMLRPGDPRAAMPGGLRPRIPGQGPPWLAGPGRGAPQMGPNFMASAGDEEYDQNAENQEEGVGHEEGFGEDYEGGPDEENVGFGNMGFGPRGFPNNQFRPPRFGMERPRFDMRGPQPGFGPRGPQFGAEFRPRAGPVPLMDIRLRAPQPSSSKEESEVGQEGEEEGQGLAEGSDQFAQEADVAFGPGARMPFRPPFGGRGFPPNHRLWNPGSILGAPPRGDARWPRPGFGERPPEWMPPPGIRGPMHRFPRMPGQQFESDPNEGFYPEGEGFDVETGFGDVPDHAAEGEQWGNQPPSKGDQSMMPGTAANASADG